ncbi:phosphotransferase system mannose-type iia component [Lucifera butyrica]|uniref:Phosphotransferase system mannose-type iia component n=1 Tax=Lucifera butyrica TaxID=1351585 RepID=A0A498R1E0_9FIRM|nr:sigma-54-dependent transcriptional regulator [Lucifera butyrica]VBB05161.1 phosphotransferase system mannose-type iia component [Lucifera butyrica]
MRRIDVIYQALTELEFPDKGISAFKLSDYLKMDRANVSRYLNQLCNERRIRKIDGRPVLYCLVREAKPDNRRNQSHSCLELMVGAELSLQISIQQAKAAILYPPRGLHTLILGETGVGKSMFAEFMYQFAVESQVIGEDAPFVRFNCADYADNPQLLLAQIFGVKKGAYSGADSDKEGLMKKADGGILFLDEIHRLPPQGQEMLFTFIDKGYFRPLGETQKLVPAAVQIIAATTEEPQSYLLKTFTRRIPMTITLPPLRERSLKERYLLVEEFIRTEAKRIGTEVYITKSALTSLLLYDCPHNTGQLKSDIQLACAKSFLNFKAQKRDYILIEQADLHQRVKRGLLKLQEKREEINDLLQDKGDILFFYQQEDGGLSEYVSEEDYGSEYFYDIIEKKLNKLKEEGLYEQQINDILNIEIENYFKKYLSDLPAKFRKEEIAKVVNRQIVNMVEEILTFAQTRLNKEFDEKVYYGLALHLHKSVERIRHGAKIYHPKLNLIRTQYADEFLTAIEIARLIDARLEIETPLDEIGYLTMFLASDCYQIKSREDGKVGVLVIMHGQATASSMCHVANSLIGGEYAQALDMPLNMKPEKMYEQAKQKVLQMDAGKGVILLIDMGSLNNFGEMLREETGIRTRIIDMASTPVVIEACRKTIAGCSLDSIYFSCQELSRYRIQTNTKKQNYNKFLIITACFTGDGAAERLKEVIQKQLNSKWGIHVAPLTLLDHNDFFAKVQLLNKEYQIVAVVSTVNIFIENVPFISASEILAGEGIAKLETLLSEEQEYLKIKKSLRTHIKSAPVETLIEDIRKIIRRIEQELNLLISQDVKMGMILHISFMVDKLRNSDSQSQSVFADLPAYCSQYGKEFSIIQETLKILEKNYQIHITQDEIAYIVRMVVENSDSV